MMKHARQRSGREHVASLYELIDGLQTLKALDIRELRHAFGLTQDQLARIAEMPVRTLARWETNTAEPRIRSLLTLCYRLRDHVYSQLGE